MATPDFAGRDVISIRDFNREELLYVLETAKRMEESQPRDLLAGKIMASLFFEPSTRTRLSFAAAMNLLGGRVIGFTDPSTTSMVKGESLSDSFRIVEGYSDVLVMRHPLEGAARLAADVIDIPVINAGDGANQHPTQTFLDLYTIQQTKGRLEGLAVGFLGDLKYGRTVHSLAQALIHFGVEMYFISPAGLRMPGDVLEDLKHAGVTYYETEDFFEVADRLEVLYCTRIQKERFPDLVEYEKVRGAYKLSRAMLGRLREDLRILHPLPRVDELDTSLDGTPNAVYFQQAHYGVPVRQALLALVLGAVK